MTAIPKAYHDTVALIDGVIEGQGEPLRAHLGASGLGKSCVRQTQLDYLWATDQELSGRMKRIFARGKREESVIVELLRNIGCLVYGDDNGQLSFSFYNGHFCGSIDGIVLFLPEAPATPHILEAKTHNDKSFRDLAKNGVKKSKPVHWAQVQIYMRYMKLNRTLYVGVNKNTDDLYIERIKVVKNDGKFYELRARTILESRELLPKVSNDPSWFECKLCPHRRKCHNSEPLEVNCRTCRYSHPCTEQENKGQWYCEQLNEVMNLERQQKPCDLFEEMK